MGVELESRKTSLESGELQRKFFTGQFEPMDAENRRIRFIISTNDVDRDNDVIDVNGWELDNFKKNPVVLWAHSRRDLPVAKAVEVGVEGNRLIAVAEFATHAFAETVFQLIKQGFLKATSVGFLAIEWAMNEERRGIDFKRLELLEFSVVPVPANQNALVTAAAAGIDLEPMREWLQKTIEAWPGELRMTGKAWDKIEGLELSEADHEEPYDDDPDETALMKDLGVSQKVSPRDVSLEMAPEDTRWRAPRLSDFTDESWEDLSASERRRIAGHYAWAASMPPESFGDLKLPHHSADGGAVVWRGVLAAIARLNQTDIPEADARAVKRHLARHFRQFRPDNDLPEVLREKDQKWLAASRVGFVEDLLSDVKALREALKPASGAAGSRTGAKRDDRDETIELDDVIDIEEPQKQDAPALHESIAAAARKRTEAALLHKAGRHMAAVALEDGAK